MLFEEFKDQCTKNTKLNETGLSNKSFLNRGNIEIEFPVSTKHSTSVNFHTNTNKKMSQS